MSRIKMMLTAMVAVLAIGAVGASAAQATGIDTGSKVGLSGQFCNILWGGASLAPPKSNVIIPANGITSSGCPTGVASATNQTNLDVSTTATNMTLNSGTIRVNTVLFSRCDIKILSPISIAATAPGSNRYVGSVNIPSPSLQFTAGGLPPNPCPTSGTVDFDLSVS